MQVRIIELPGPGVVIDMTMEEVGFIRAALYRASRPSNLARQLRAELWNAEQQPMPQAKDPSPSEDSGG